MKFDFQKRRGAKLPYEVDPQCLGRIFRAGGEIPPKPDVVIVGVGVDHTLEAEIARRVQSRLDVIMIADSGSSVGVSLHDDLLAETKPLDISKIIDTNRSQR